MHWHFAPQWRVTQVAPSALRADRDDAGSVWLLSASPAGAPLDVVIASEDGSIGWCAPVYGPLVPTTAARQTISGRAPLYAVTAIVDGVEAARIDLLPVAGEAAAHDIAFAIVTSAATEIVLFGWAEDGQVAGRARRVRRVAGIETDARVLCWREGNGDRGSAAVLIDGSTAGRARDAADDPRAAGAATLQATGVA